jgi:F-type H+-transporting ATPase subunit b
MFHINSPEFWVAISFLIFVGILVKMGVPALVTKALDDRADTVRKELDQARRLREEAQDLLADYQRKQRAADDEAQAVSEVRAAAVDVAMSTAERLISEKLATDGGADLMSRSIRDLKGKLN